MGKRNLFAAVCLSMIVVTANAQIFRVQPNVVDVLSQARIFFPGTGDGLDITTNNSTDVLESGADLIWGAFYQAQPNNPGILSLTTLPGSTPCFTVRANGNTGIFNRNPSVALEIGSSTSIRQVKVNGNIVLGSDARMKENIRDITPPLNRLKQLRSITYNLKEQQEELVIPDKVLNDPSVDIEKLKEELKKLPKTNKELLNRNFYGFLAQDVQKLFPDLVYKDSEGMLSIDYIGMIPLLVDGLKEQQTRIEQLQTQIDEQQKQIASILKAMDARKFFSDDTIETVPLLFQNIPNPFNQSTEIRFYIPAAIQTASLYIYDMNGIRKMNLNITARGNNSVTVNASSLEAGLYFYTLICDGKPIDTKQIILTK
jgi:hypothetical protein